jgi:hypothetical protein
MSGEDLTEDVRRFVDEGALVTLPADLYSPCARLEMVTPAGKPAFQKVVLTPAMDAAARAACVKRMGGLTAPE